MSKRSISAPFGLAASAGVLTLTASLSVAQNQHVDQNELNRLIEEGRHTEAFEAAFDAGEALTSRTFDTSDGVGANIGNGGLFARIPRADLDGPEDWANHYPARETGVNAATCAACHSVPLMMGAGDLSSNILADPSHSADPAKFLTRNPPSLFALGIPQRLAEEISLDLRAQSEATRVMACDIGGAQIDLSSKGVSYGTLVMRRIAETPCAVEIDHSGLDGIEHDLTIRPFGWKGTQASVRTFARNAAHNELGLQATELVGDADGDFDGVTHELSMGDITAITVFLSTLPRPVSTLELADLGLKDLEDGEKSMILAGEGQFEEIGCASCHIPQMTLNDPVFSEPTSTLGYFDTVLPDGEDPTAHGLSVGTAITADLSADQPHNRIMLPGAAIYHLGALEMSETGAPVARWYTDFKRHEMGAELADPSDPLGMGSSVFSTRSLAGVGSTGPWLHDGRAMKLDAAILAHGGAAQGARDSFAALGAQEQAEIIAFLKSLVLYQAE